MNELMIITRQAPGVVTFDNFEEIKAWLAERLEDYKNLAYTEDSLKIAKADKAELNRLKKHRNAEKDYYENIHKVLAWMQKESEKQKKKMDKKNK